MKKNFFNHDIYSQINGQLVNNNHYYSIRIFYEDTDVGGIVYHSNYLKYFERARTSLLNLIKINQKDLLQKQKLSFVVRNINIRINKSFSFNEILFVKTCLKSAKKSSIILNQEAYDTKQKIIENLPKVTCEIQIVMIDDKNKVRDITKVLNHPFFKNK